MKTNRLTIILTILCLLSGLAYTRELPVASPQDVGMSPEKLAGVRKAVQNLLDKEKIAGASVIIVRKGSIVFSETFGMVDMEAQKAMQSDTIFRFYSMTKPVTSVAVMMLYDLFFNNTVNKQVFLQKHRQIHRMSEELAHQVTIRFNNGEVQHGGCFFTILKHL